MKIKVKRKVTVQLKPESLGECAHFRIHRLGHSGSQVVYHVNQDEIQHTLDEASGLPLFPIEEVFLDRNSVLVGCGNPNAATTVYRADGPKGPGWYKFAAFMFWRQDAYIAPTKGRLQSGVYLELRNLPDEDREDIWKAMGELSGKRSPSCARLNAAVLAAAGFTFGNGRSLLTAIRPSKYTGLFWRHGISYKGQGVDIRVVITGEKGVGDHMKGAWLKEVTSPGRTVKKMYAEKKLHPPAPVFESREVGEVGNRWYGWPTTIGVNRPSRFGVWTSYAFGQQPVYSVKLDHVDLIPELHGRLSAYDNEAGDRKIDLQTWIKKTLLFSPLSIWLIRRFRHRSMDLFEGVPARAALDMLVPSVSPDHDTAVLYNCVVVQTDDSTAEAHITPLKNQDPASQNDRLVKFFNWIMAKHVLISGYDPDTIYACELWLAVDQFGEPVLYFNDNSGTYQPSVKRGVALGNYLEDLFGIQVEFVPMGEVTVQAAA